MDQWEENNSEWVQGGLVINLWLMVQTWICVSLYAAAESLFVAISLTDTWF